VPFYANNNVGFSNDDDESVAKGAAVTSNVDG